MQINNPLWPFELGAIPAATGEGVLGWRGSGSSNGTALTVPAWCVLKAGDKDMSLAL